MNKLKILLTITTIGILLYILHFISLIYMWDYYTELYKATEDRVVFGKYNFIIGHVSSVIIFIGLCLSFKCIYTIIKQGFFTELAKKLLRIAGSIFLFLGVLTGIIDIVRVANEMEESVAIGIILVDFLLTIVGLIVLIIADMAQTGYQLKSENDLTI
ncbi:DUF2975 domain-containing protein [Dokdonia sp. Hel_I_53]|uniref:DUF2975 domain-containing protein n=1 Tax=Dokdonia sp. Hel_I_53 TaxID=1566287 RepID=UPI00119B21B5|nr:DUF2975 domain-containing protein [Dokdonia sp. Hel_I_53]TVZ52433.1 Protein of unknown function (DUF2975) [Dokdonia sp. Hel_I_53]